MILPQSIWFGILLIFFLILINGFFAGSEIAVVSSRRSRMDQLAREGKSGASIVSKWLKEPETFLAVTQIMVTLAGALASALSGVIAVEHLKPAIERWPLFSRWAEPVSIVLVVVAMTYLTLIFGELVPKCLGLSYRERIAILVSLPINWIAKAARPMVLFLTQSTRMILFLLGLKGVSKDLFVSE